MDGKSTGPSNEEAKAQESPAQSVHDACGDGPPNSSTAKANEPSEEPKSRRFQSEFSDSKDTEMRSGEPDQPSEVLMQTETPTSKESTTQERCGCEIGKEEVEVDKSSKSVRNAQKEKAKGEEKATKGKGEKEEENEKEKEKREEKEDKQEEGKEEGREGKKEKKEKKEQRRNRKKGKPRREAKKEVNESAKGEATVVHASHVEERRVKAGLTTNNCRKLRKHICMDKALSREQRGAGKTATKRSVPKATEAICHFVSDIIQLQTLPIPSLVGCDGPRRMERRQISLSILLQQGNQTESVLLANGPSGHLDTTFEIKGVFC
eukprot:Skav203886  [mRNA]  locus=scaffold1649:98662:102796:+ [translate_table: standard]